MLQRNGLIITAIATGLADDVIPRDAAVTIQDQLAEDARCRLIFDLYIQWAGFDTSAAEAATSRLEIQIWRTSKTVVFWMNLNDRLFTGRYTGLSAIDAFLLQRSSLMPGRSRAQWIVLPGLFCAALPGQVGAA
jgi:hypothetical protein